MCRVHERSKLSNNSFKNHVKRYSEWTADNSFTAFINLGNVHFYIYKYIFKIARCYIKCTFQNALWMYIIKLCV